jgi:hypothetical protein
MAFSTIMAATNVPVLLGKDTGEHSPGRLPLIFRFSRRDSVDMFAG